MINQIIGYNKNYFNSIKKGQQIQVNILFDFNLIDEQKDIKN